MRYLSTARRMIRESQEIRVDNNNSGGEENTTNNIRKPMSTRKNAGDNGEGAEDDSDDIDDFNFIGILLKG